MATRGNVNDQPGGREPSGREELIRIIRQVRRRWRVRVALRGVAAVAGAALGAVLVGAVAMDLLRFSAGAVIAARVLVYAAVVGAAVRYLVLPLARRVSDERVALYIEEHEPSLEAALVSALSADGGPGPSPALARRLVEDVVSRVRALDLPRRVERRRLRAGAAIAGGVVAAGAVLAAFGPGFVRSGARLVFWPWETAEAATPYAINVEPGNVTVPRGADVGITARLRGFEAEGAEVRVRRGNAVEWEPVPMSAGRGPGEYTVRLFDLDSAAQYVVESEGVRSPVYAITVADLPYVRRIALEYRFPAYTGLPAQTVDDGGDVAALRGTTVRVRATPTVPVRGGRIIVEGGDTIPLAPADSGALAGTLRVDRNGFYRVELQAPDGAMVRGSLDYVIDVLPDRPPTVAIAEPGRDVKVTRLEEVFASVQAEDDYGVQRVELVYSVNGGREQTVVLHSAGGRRTPDVTAGHTFFLEELPLEPGDFVSYYARARDNDAVSGAHAATTDIYFMQVRPFDQHYRQAEQPGGAGRQESPNGFAERQREIVAATFKLVRDRATIPERQWREDLTTLTLAQGRLREQVQGLADRVLQRGGALADSALRQIAEALPIAVTEMRAAEEQLGRRRAPEALPPEQRALQQLQRAEAAFRDVQVSLGGGGPGEAGQSSPGDLSDLFGLDVDKLRSQYETLERGRQQQREADAEVDRTLARLKELAARQQRQAEQLRRQAEAQRGGGGGSGGGDAQRQLAEEAERLARTLERLERERPSPELRQGIRRLQEAASEMRRAASQGRAQESSAATASAAADRLHEAERALGNSRASRLERDVRDAQRQAAELAEEQRRVAAEAERLAGAGPAAAQSGQLPRLLDRKDSLAAGVSSLERELDRMARETRREQPEASRKLQEAANAIRDSQIRERLRFSKDVVRGGSAEYARNLEEQITGNIEDVRGKVDAAASAVRAPDSRRAAQALDRARELARGMESLGERMRQRREQGGAPGGGQTTSPGDSARAGAQGGAQGGEGSARASANGQTNAQGGADGSAQRGGGQSSGSAGGPPGAPSPGFGGGGQGAAVGGGGSGGFSPDDVRQFGREVERRRAEAEELRRALVRQGYATGDLDSLIARMRTLEQQRAYANAGEAERLQASVVDGLKAFEFALRRRIEGDQEDPPRLGGSDDVPAEFRALVEEYYRSLARTKQR